VEAVTLSPPYVLMSDGIAVRVVDAEDPEAPRILGSVTTPGTAGRIAIERVEGYVYVADGDSGIHVLDIADPTDPRIIRSIRTHFPAKNVLVSGPRLYARVGYAVHVYGIADPTDPQLLGTAPAGSSHALAASGDYLYVTNSDFFLYMVFSDVSVIDMSDPGEPRIISQIPFGNARDLAVSGDLLYVVDREYGLRVFDISDPGEPHPRAGVSIWPSPHAVAVSEDRVCVTGYSGDLFTIARDDSPVAPLIGRVGTAGWATAVAVAGDHAFVACGYGGVQVVDISDRQHPRVVGGESTNGSALGIAVAEPYVYVATDDDGFHVLDVSVPQDPRPVGQVPRAGGSVEVDATGSYAYLAGGSSGLHVIDVRVPEAPSIIGNIETPGNALRVALTPSHAYVADQGGGLQVVDISSPENPRIVGSIVSGSCIDVAVMDGYAYLATYESLRVVDVHVPEAPSLVGSIPLLDGVYAVAAGDRTVYVTGYLDVQIVDVTYPEHPHLVGSMNVNSEVIPPPGTRATLTDCLYFGGGNEGLEIFSLHCAGVTPIKLLSFTAARYEERVVLTWETSMESQHAGFRVYRRSDDLPWERLTSGLISGGPRYSYTDLSATPGQAYLYEIESVSRTGETERFGPVEVLLPRYGVELRVSRNPSSAPVVTFSLPEAGEVTLRVFDVSGRLVKILWDGYRESGSHEIAWNGEDDQGRSMPGGIYFMRLDTVSDQKTGRLVLTH
jgi:hypothetical protein